ncbi:Nuclear transport factor 2 (NTF2) family protein with RNA binding (RRM-RBD-RNP motifs) domain [Striga hermonthica]|uniref:Nuclear transport factor 2 (NTF2) family protein with RNA binding (RRM-RBD-RNP motifs) domain n=1 Tax=Striga hermonthica TaxID=68872 RepID=A0A9N7NZI1_STRHE|nr:Nuclear transport factor 2 (NTF2) family protein with RNA binding (RRM-RBD-RNP motifs) domain [Striga hermonthica]
MAAAVGSQQPVSTQTVGRVFVEKYYTILHSSPELAHKFYQDKSTIQRFEEDGSMSVTTTCQAIKEKIASLNYGDLRVEIKSVDSSETLQEDNGYFVLSDQLRYIVNGNPTLGSDVVVRPTTTPEESAIADEVYSSSEDGDILFFGGIEVQVSYFIDKLMHLKGAAASFSPPPGDPGKAPLNSGHNKKAHCCSEYVKRPPKNAMQTSLEDVFKKFGPTQKYRNQVRRKRASFVQEKRWADSRTSPISIGGDSGYNKGGLDSRFKFTSFCPIKENPNLKEEWSLPNRETSMVLLRLHAKHIAVCRCVCRSWLSLTTSQGFISAQLDHARSESDPQFLFHESVPSLERDKAPVKPTQSGLVCFSPDTLIIGSINGLICSTGNWRYCSWPTPNDIWIWNPSTGLSKKLPMGIRLFERFSNIQATFAFCWDEESDVYKVVRIISKKWEPTFAEVWSSDINSWEEIDLTDCPYFYHPSSHVNLVPTTVCNVFVGNSPHWAVLDYDGNPFILSFDVKTSKLKLLSFPSQLSSDPEDVAMLITVGCWQLIVTNWMGELAVLDYYYMTAKDENDYETLGPLLSDIKSMYSPYRLWTMEANGRWICSCLVSFGIDFRYCLNSVGGGKYMLLQTPSEIALYDILESRVIRTYEGREAYLYISAFDFVGSLVSMEGSEPFGDDFSKLVTLTWPSHLQMNLNPRKQLLMLPEKDKLFADEMERDPDESPLPAPYWESQEHFINP